MINYKSGFQRFGMLLGSAAGVYAAIRFHSIPEIIGDEDPSPVEKVLGELGILALGTHLGRYAGLSVYNTGSCLATEPKTAHPTLTVLSQINTDAPDTREQEDDSPSSESSPIQTGSRATQKTAAQKPQIPTMPIETFWGDHEIRILLVKDNGLKEQAVVNGYDMNTKKIKITRDEGPCFLDPDELLYAPETDDQLFLLKAEPSSVFTLVKVRGHQGKTCFSYHQAFVVKAEKGQHIRAQTHLPIQHTSSLLPLPIALSEKLQTHVQNIQNRRAKKEEIRDNAQRIIEIFNQHFPQLNLRSFDIRLHNKDTEDASILGVQFSLTL